MTYELAKQLKEAGFPYRPVHDGETRDFIYGDLDFGKVRPEGAVIGEGYVVPRLSELMAACGEGFFAISHWPEGWTAEGGPIIQNQIDGLWTAQIQCKDLPTPEEAVANLWLVLHDKTKK